MLRTGNQAISHDVICSLDKNASLACLEIR